MKKLLSIIAIASIVATEGWSFSLSQNNKNNGESTSFRNDGDSSLFSLLN